MLFQYWRTPLLTGAAIALFLALAQLPLAGLATLPFVVCFLLADWKATARARYLLRGASSVLFGISLFLPDRLALLVLGTLCALTVAVLCKTPLHFQTLHGKRYVRRLPPGESIHSPRRGQQRRQVAHVFHLLFGNHPALRSGTLYCAQKCGQIVGAAMLRGNYLCYLGVLPQVRREGYARALLNASPLRLYAHVQTTNQDALAFYIDALGWRVCGTLYDYYKRGHHAFIIAEKEK